MTNAQLAALFLPICISLGLAAYSFRRSRMTDFERQTVDEFLRRALHPEGGYRFTGVEWADRPPEDEPREKAEKKPKKSLALPARFEPPLVRLHCTGCNQNWDAWVSDEGELEDERDGRCACDKGGYVCIAKEDD